MKYFAKITRQKDKSYLVRFPDLPGCLSEGESLIKALKNAKEALNGWLAANCDRDLNIPPAKTKKGKSHYPIFVNLSTTFCIYLRQFRKKNHLSQAQAAKKLKISQQAYAKLELPLIANPSLKTIQNISKFLNLEFELFISRK